VHELLFVLSTFGKDSDIGWESTGQMMGHDLQMIIFFSGLLGGSFFFAGRHDHVEGLLLCSGGGRPFLLHLLIGREVH